MTSTFVRRARVRACVLMRACYSRVMIPQTLRCYSLSILSLSSPRNWDWSFLSVRVKCTLLCKQGQRIDIGGQRSSFFPPRSPQPLMCPLTDNIRGLSPAHTVGESSAINNCPGNPLPFHLNHCRWGALAEDKNPRSFLSDNFFQYFQPFISCSC